MGLASSQARLLLLTARKSDLEYRSQMISQRKIMLAMETETLATDYTRSMSNRVMNLVFQNDPNSTNVLKQTLTYGALISYNTLNPCIVTDSEGNMIVPSADPKTWPAGCAASSDGKSVTFKGQTYKLNVLEDVSNAYAFQSALREGGLIIQQFDSSTSKMQNKPLSAMSDIQDDLYKDDDAAAQALYESKSLVIQNQDKMLDLELKQIETQHKAIETEYDSVKKVIDKNIEVSYKIFANG